MPYQLEIWIVQQMSDVRLSACEKIIEAQHVVPVGEQPLAQMAANKSSTPREKDAFAKRIVHIMSVAVER